MKIVAKDIEEFQRLDNIAKKIITLVGSDVEKGYELIEVGNVNTPTFIAKRDIFKRFIIPKGSRVSMIRFSLDQDGTNSILITIILDGETIEFKLDGYKTLTEFMIVEGR